MRFAHHKSGATEVRDIESSQKREVREMNSSPEPEKQDIRSSSTAVAKKPYNKPILKVYGNVEALTGTVAMNQKRMVEPPG